MAQIGRYDPHMQQFVENPPINRQRLDFMRWLAERGKLEHGVAGPASGPMVPARAERAEVAA